MKEWFLHSDASGYLTSLAVHLLLLIVLSILLVDEVGSGSFSTLASHANRDKVQFDDLIDTRMDLSGDEFQSEQLPELAVIEAPEAAVALPIDAGQLMEELGKNESGLSGDDGPGGRFSPPAGGNAVTQGSFTVWAEPVDPAVRQPYTIYIRVRLPRRVHRYRAGDLSGLVVGTDGHEQRIPWDSRWPGVAHTVRSGSDRSEAEETMPLLVNGSLPVKKGYALLMVRVPGSRIPKTEDTITIESRILEEKQTLKIIFGARALPAAD